MNPFVVKYGAILVTTVVAVTFGIVLCLLLSKSIPDSDPVKILIGTLAAKFGDSVNFWVGSSSGSKAKDEIVAGQAK